MGSGPTQTQNQNQIQNTTQAGSGTQVSQLSPWAPIAGALTSAGQQAGAIGTGVTPQQSAAISNLGGVLAGLPNFAPQSSQAVSNLFSATTQPQQGMLGSAYNSFLGQLSPILNPANLNPMNTPGFSTALGQTEADITNQINMGAAAAGATPSSPGYAQALARGLASGVAPTIAGQYNTNVGNLLNAAGQGFGAAGTTATGITAQQSQQLQDQLQGLSATGQLPGILSAAPSAQLQAANLAYAQPFQNISTQLGVLSPLAQTFGTQTGAGTYQGTGTGVGSGTTTTTTSQPWYNTALGVGLLGAGLLSDVRAKEDIEPVGVLFNRAPIYTFKYKHDPTHATHMGLLAQDVEQWMPEAVGQDPATGLKTVRYDLATQPVAGSA